MARWPPDTHRHSVPPRQRVITLGWRRVVRDWRISLRPRRTLGFGMVAQRQPRTFTLEQYLDLEHSSDSRNELIDGVIYAMTGGTPRHAQLCLRIGAMLHTALRGRKCVPYSSDLHL